jgi:hypothetical protein
MRNNENEQSFASPQRYFTQALVNVMNNEIQEQQIPELKVTLGEATIRLEPEKFNVDEKCENIHNFAHELFLELISSPNGGFEDDKLSAFFAARKGKISDIIKQISTIEPKEKSKP